MPVIAAVGAGGGGRGQSGLNCGRCPPSRIKSGLSGHDNKADKVRGACLAIKLRLDVKFTDRSVRSVEPR